MADTAPLLAGGIDPKTFPRMYLNILVQSGPSKEALQEKISEQVNAKVSNKVLRNLATKTAAKVASVKVTQDLVAEKMAQNMPKMMPEKMAEMGMQAEVEEVFRKGAFVVVRITVQQVDIVKAISTKVSAESGERVGFGLKCLRTIARWLGYGDLFEEKFRNSVNRKVAAQLCEKMPEKLPEKLSAEKGIKVEVEAKLEAEQAAYFFDAIAAMH
mmetsp:Transcript_11667/g.21223  ORF Transcript_11667/g.21223 Transcript_11667/m.21223 type:complete len:214 (-) Transcript_11667:39-680(-)